MAGSRVRNLIDGSSAVVIDNPGVDWYPFTNQVAPAAVSNPDHPIPEAASVTDAPEPTTR